MLIDPKEMLSCRLFRVKFIVLLEVSLVWKQFPHLAHINGFSPVWTRWCLLA